MTRCEIRWIVRVGLALAACSQATTAMELALGPVKFESPAGWAKVGANGDELSFSSVGDREGRRCVISVRLLPSVKDEAGLREALLAGMRAALGKVEFGQPAVQTALHEQGYMTLACWVMPFDAKGWPYFAYFRAVDCKSHVAVFALVDTAAAAGGDQAARAAFEKVVGGCSIGDGSRLAGSPLALGSPPLTQALVDRAASRVEIALEMKLTAPQRALLARALQAYWREQWTGVGAYVSGLNLWDARMAERGRGRAGAIVRARAEILLGCCGRPDGGFEKSILEGRWQKPAEARSGERVLVEARDSMGALTDGDVARYAAFVEWVVGVKLTGAHLEALSRQIRADWRAGGWITMPLTGALRTWGAASRLGESDRAVIAAYYRANYLRSIAHTFTPTEVIVMKAYDAAYPTLAKGSETLHEPALTADVAGAYAELVCFQANAVAGRDVYAVTPEARAAAGRGLATDYAALSGRMQYSLVLLHETLAETRLTWPMLTDAERAAVRQQWAAWFARPPAPAGGSAEALLEAATVRERADDAAYRKTPQAASWELIRIRAVAETERRGREEANEAMKQWQR